MSLFVSTSKKDSLGCSNLEEIPVKFSISPVRAFLYRPFVSLFSQIDKSEFIYIPIKFSSPIISFALFLIVFVGLTKQLIVIIPQLIKSLEISEIRLIFSNLSFSEKLKLLLIPDLILSPSKTCTK